MSDSRGSSSPGDPGKNGARRAAGVRRSTPAEVKGSSRTSRAEAGAGAKAASSKPGSAKPGSAKSGSAKSGSPASGSSTSSKGKGRGSSRTAAAGAGAAAGATTLARRAKPKKNLLNYPRAGKKGVWRWFPSLRMILGAFALLVIAGVAAVVWLYQTTEVPEPSDVALAQTTRVYFSDGETEMGKFSQINRTIIPSDEIPDNIKNAVVASEDSTFYENRGVSPRGVVRALVNNLSGKSRQGGSTITMQYIERYYTGTNTSYLGKAQEAMMALKADEELSKDEILSRYLNTIYFGRGAYGVQEASQAYFGKDAKDLTDAEAALLVAVIPAPSAYDPAKNPERAASLWDRVIERQVNVTGKMTAEQADALEFPKTVEPKNKNALAGTNGYLMAAVKSELTAQGYDEDTLETGGFTIVSTIDPKIQENTVLAIADLPEDRPANNRVGTITIDPQTGAIKAMYGGKDYVTQSYNDATQSRMQGGSIFKTFTLVAALQEGYSLNTQLNGDSPHTFRGGWRVKNFGGTSYGTVNLKKATTSSINTAYAELNIEMGPEKTRDAAIQLGLPEDTPDLNAYDSNVLGTAAPTVQEMAEAYSTIAAKGVYHPSYIVQSVTNSDGSSEYEHKDASKTVLDEAVAVNATVALQGPPTQGSARYVGQNMDGRPVAGKTGTSESFKSAWFVGFTPQLVTAVGMFQPSDAGAQESLTPFGGEDDITGGTFPTQVWTHIMKPSLEGQEMLEFPEQMRLDNQKRSSRSDDDDDSSSKTSSTRTPKKEKKTTEAPETEEPSPEETTPEETTPPAETTPQETPSEKPSTAPAEERTTSAPPAKTTPPAKEEGATDEEDTGPGNGSGTSKPDKEKPTGGASAGKPSDEPSAGADDED
ncbi:transglycosylase domain-containing protein [Brachybacterium hainanense]|uniref:Transglycosylase domain-containing protein n=1 Tax=Brachybacterium hainanense TaxID=1541174 RepID=A0ABV6RGQ1_9MICO